MKYSPPGHRILVKPSKIAEEELLDTKYEHLKKINLEIKKPDGQLHRDKQGCDTGIVLAIGPMAWKHKDMGYGEEGWQPWCKVGDKILFTRYSGKLITDTDTKEDYYVLNDDDIQLVEVTNG